MARRHGRNSRVYMGLSGTAATAEPLQGIASWGFSAETEKAEVTALGDANKLYVAGLPDASGDLTGFFDDATVQTYTAATDGAPRKAYFYPDIVNSPAMYWHGQILPDFKATFSVGGASEYSASWNAATAMIKVG